MRKNTHPFLSTIVELTAFDLLKILVGKTLVIAGLEVKLQREPRPDMQACYTNVVSRYSTPLKHPELKK